jgi:hypothetical protein
MTPEQVEQFRSAMTAAVEDHLAKGGTLCSGAFGNDDKIRCPISCLLDTSITSESRPELITKKLGFQFSLGEMWIFIDSFDGRGWAKKSLLSQVGRELRQKYLPVEK